MQIVWRVRAACCPMASSSTGAAALEELDLEHRANRGGRKQRRLAREEIVDRAPAGGAQDRLVVVLASAPTELFDSVLAFELVNRWAWGRASAWDVQRLSHKAHEDQVKVLQASGSSIDFCSQSLRRLGALGRSGANAGSIGKDLRSFLGSPGVLPPQLFPVAVLIQKPRSREPILRSMQLPFMLPHLQFADMFHNEPGVFENKMLGDVGADALCAFWTGVVARRDPRIAFHPMCRRPAWERHAIPLALHGDAVPVVRVGRPGTKSLDCISWQSMLAGGSTLKVKLWAFGIFQQSKHKLPIDGSTPTMDTVWQILCWSLRALFEGTHPLAAWDGSPWEAGTSEASLAGKPLCSTGQPFFAVLWSLKGDIKWFSEELGLRNHASNEPCDFCPASKSGNPDMWPTNFSTTAAWKTMLRSAAQWRALNAENMHSLFRTFGFLSHHNVEPDELHVLHLGVSQYFLGSVLWLLVYKRLLGRPVANMQTIWAAIVEQYNLGGTGTPFTSLGISSFTEPARWRLEFPRLKGKGSETKGLVAPVLAVWQQHCEPDEHDRTMTAALVALDGLQQILDESSSDMFLSSGGSERFRQSIDDFLRAYTWLGVQADRRGDLLFSAVPKLHWLWHLSHRSQFLHPRRAACFIDEDFVKHMKTLGAKCTASVPLHEVPSKMMNRYGWAMRLQALGRR